MVRLKLQLFALNTKTSIVDYLKSQGKDSSYSARKQMAQQMGISNYSGTAEQNTQMLKALQNQSASASNTAKAVTSTTNTAPAMTRTAVSPISGVDQTLVDKANSQFAQSGNVSNAQSEADSLRDKYNAIASERDIIDQATWDKLNSSFVTSDAYNQAMAYTNQLLEQLSSGRTSYTDQIKDLMGQIQNREDFSYDMAEDTMFQQMLSSAMTSGQSAMMDTMGQASSLTGGYGSTYAQSAGNQAYNAYVQDAYANLPQYYEMALEAYQMEGQEMYDQLAMLSEADDREYGRMYDAWNTNFTTAQQMYAQEYGAWQDSVNNAYNSANLQLNEYGMAVDNAYNMYQASQNRADTMYAQEYQKWADEVANAMQYMNMQNSDYWANQNFIEQQRQFEADLAERQRQHNESLAWDKESFAQQMAEDKRQFEVSQSAKASGSNTTYEGTNGESVNTDDIPKAISTKASKFKTNGELEQYLDEQVKSGTITESEADYLYATYRTPDKLGLTDREWTMTDDGGNNFFWGIDGNGRAKDQYGEEYTMDDLYKELKKTMGDKEAKQWVIDLQKKLGIAN